MDIELLNAKEAIFSLIGQFHRPSKFDDGELYIYNYCESALEKAFDILGIEENYIKLMDFCKLWENNTRAIWETNFPDEPFGGITSDIHYQVFKEDYDTWERISDYLNEDE